MTTGRAVETDVTFVGVQIANSSIGFYVAAEELTVCRVTILRPDWYKKLGGWLDSKDNSSLTKLDEEGRCQFAIPPNEAEAALPLEEVVRYLQSLQGAHRTARADFIYSRPPHHLVLSSRMDGAVSIWPANGDAELYTNQAARTAYRHNLEDTGLTMGASYDSVRNYTAFLTPKGVGDFGRTLMVMATHYPLPQS